MNIQRSEVVRNNFNKHRSQFKTNLVEYAFIVNLVSIRTFEGYKVEVVRGFRNKRYKAQNLFIPPHSP